MEGSSYVEEKSKEELIAGLLALYGTELKRELLLCMSTIMLYRRYSTRSFYRLLQKSR
jgi:hypothetical protein